MIGGVLKQRQCLFAILSTLFGAYNLRYYDAWLEAEMEKLESFLEYLFEEGLVTDGAMAQNLGQMEDFWNVRELCNPASAATGTF